MMMALSACSFPSTPGEGNLMNAGTQYQKDLFDTGARGQIVVSMSDTLSDGGWFGTVYDNFMNFKNKQSGEQFFVKTKLNSIDYATAMLPVGEYEVTNLYMQRTYTTSTYAGKTTIVTTHVVTYDHFERGKSITFTVRPGDVTYLGNLQMVKADKGTDSASSFAGSVVVTDKSADIPDKKKSEWEKKFGRPLTVQLVSMRDLTAAEVNDQKMKDNANEVK